MVELVTSPAVIYSRISSDDVTLEEVQIALLCVRPKQLTELQQAFSQVSIDKAVQKKILICAGSTEHQSLGLWEYYNWGRAFPLMFAGAQPRGDRKQYSAMGDQPETNETISLDALFRRRSRRAFKDSGVAYEHLIAVTNVLSTSSKRYVWLRNYVVIQNVNGIKPGVYTISPTSNLELVTDAFDARELSDTVQGMWWVNGGGYCVFLVVHWPQVLGLSEGTSVGYLDMLLTLGIVGQMILNTVYTRGLGAWMTPAVMETMAAKVLHLKNREFEAMYFVKIGEPDTNGIDS